MALLARRTGALLALALSVLAVLPVAASAQGSVAPQTVIPRSQTAPPPGFRLSAVQAYAVAERLDEVRRARADHPGVRRVAVINWARTWSVDYYVGDHTYVEVDVNALTGEVKDVWTGPQVNDLLARGGFGGPAESPFVWLPLCVLFLVPFVDRRRPLRLLHLDLAAMLAFGASYFFFTRGEVDLSVPLTYPPLLYLLFRMLWAGFRPRARRERLVPHVPMRWLAIGLALLVVARIGLNVAEDRVLDVGYAGVVGADRIMHGEDLYVANDAHGDTYGPVNYIVYAPFEALLPWRGDSGSLPAAHVVAILFDLLTLAGLFVLGTRMRRGPPGRRLGVALAFAWAAYPFSTLPLAVNANDAMIAAVLVWALVSLASPLGRGLWIGLGAAAKFAPLVLAPLFAAGRGERSLRAFLAAGGVTVLVTAVSIAIYLPDGGLREFWDCTLGLQLSRTTSFSVWAQHPSLGALQVALEAAAVALALAVAWLPRRREVGQVAALAAAVLIAVELPARHWFYFYLVWFAPLALVALFSEQRTADDHAGTPDEIESAAFTGAARSGASVGA